MRIKGNSVEPTEKKEREVIPTGTYPVKVLDVQVKQTKGGEDYWSLKLEIQGGPYDGRFVFDSLFFTPKALNRFYLVWKRLTGFELDRTQDLDVDESDLFGCKAFVKVVTKEETYNGETSLRAKVPYDGYMESEPIDTVKSGSKVDEDDDLPAF